MKTEKLLKTGTWNNRMREKAFTVPASAAGGRLDKALGAAFPGLGLRGCRRFWKRGEVLVNGRARPPGYSVREGDAVRVRLPDVAGESVETKDAPRLLAEVGALLFLYKPAGLHSVALAGSAGASLEGMLPRLCDCAGEPPVLLNRLDQGTSGIVAAARSSEGKARWRWMEDAGLCEKRYLAVLEGKLETPLIVACALDTAHRATSVALAEACPPLRHTCLEPLGVLEEKTAACLFPGDGAAALTLAGCLIHKGARHQIRAHAAHAGYPLAGDGRYGARREGAFLLHHGALRLADKFAAGCVPVWWERIPAPLRAAAAVWLGSEASSG